MRYENYGTFVDKDGTLRNLILGSGSTFTEQLASARVDFVDRFYPPDNNNIAPRLGFAWDPTGDARTAVRGYGIAYDRLMNLPAENYRHSPPLRASVSLGQVFGHLSLTVSAIRRRPSGLPGRSRVAGGPRSAERRDRRKGRLTAVDPNLKMPHAHNWFLASRGISRAGSSSTRTTRVSRPRAAQCININRFVGDLIDGRQDGFNPSFSNINWITSTSQSTYHGMTISARRNMQHGFMVQGAYTIGRAIDDADAAVNVTNYQDAANIQGTAQSPATTRGTKCRSLDCGSCRSSETAPGSRGRCWAAGSLPVTPSCNQGRR